MPNNRRRAFRAFHDEQEFILRLQRHDVGHGPKGDKVESPGKSKPEGGGSEEA
jgi:hypothetical protein